VNILFFELEPPAVASDTAARTSDATRSKKPACTEPPAMYFPVIDRNRCEGKAACVRVCPQNVFEVRTIEAEDYDALSFVGKIRNAVHGRKSAYTPNASQCRACGECVDACPENAISLVTFSRG